MKKSFTLLPLVSLVSLSTNAFDEFDSSGELDFLATNVVTIPVDEMPNSAWSTTVLTKADIQRSGARTIPEALRLIPGFVYATPYGSYRTATYKGMSDEYPRRIRIEVDNTPINLASTGSVFWGALPFNLEDVESISFVANPSSVLNGSQAFNGVVKIKTVKADQINNKVSAAYGTANYRSLYLRGAGTFGEKFSAQISASRYVSDGEHETRSDENKRKLWGNFLYAADNFNVISSNIGIGLLSDDYHTEVGQQQYGTLENRGMSNTIGNINWTNNRFGQTSLTLGVTEFENDIVNNFDSFTVGDVTLTPVFDIAYTSKRQYAELEHKNQFAGFDVSLGGNLTVDHEVPRYFSKDDAEWNSKIYDANVYVSKSIADVEIGGGMAYQKHSDYQEPLLSRSLAFNYNVAKGQSLSLLYSESGRFPVNWEAKSQLYVAMLEYPDITITNDDMMLENISKPEKIKSLSLKYELYRGYEKSFTLRAFRDDYSDLIYRVYRPYEQTATDIAGHDVDYLDQENVPSAISNGQGDRLLVHGLELHSKWRLNANNQLLASFANHRISSDRRNTVDMSETMPETVVTLMWSTRIAKLDMNFLYNRYSSAWWESENIPHWVKEFDGYQTASMNMKYCFANAGLSQACASFHANNLLASDSSYYSDDDPDDIKVRTIANYYLSLEYLF